MFTDGTLIICLGINILLCGLIMYYCKRKFNGYDHKLQSMMELISALTELTEEEMSKDPTATAQDLNTYTTNEATTNEVTTNEVTTNEATTNEATTNEATTNEATTNDSTSSAYSNLRESYSNNNELLNPYMDLHNLVNVSEDFNQSDDSLSDSDSDSDSDNEDEDNNEEAIERDTVSLHIVNNEQASSSETIKLVALEGDNTEEPINYDKLTVLELRTKVKERNLSSHPTRLKRNELLNLLQ